MCVCLRVLERWVINSFSHSSHKSSFRVTMDQPAIMLEAKNEVGEPSAELD